MPRNNSNSNTKKKTSSKKQNNIKETKTQKKDKQRKRPVTINAATTQTKPYFAKQPKDVYGSSYEYRMSQLCANDILKECPSTIRPEQYLCNYVTEQYGLLGWCRRVIVE